MRVWQRFIHLPMALVVLPLLVLPLLVLPLLVLA